MSLPAPDLDDRRFQELVDDAKRLVQRRCPEWTDHNVSDPGVTLIETFAFMVDQLLYRLNRVPDRLYVKFLDLVGIRPYPPTAARTSVNFWLSAPQDEAVTVPEATRVATPRTGDDDPVVFRTDVRLEIPPCELTAVGTAPAEATPSLHTDRFELGEGFAAFSEPPTPGDALLIGLSAATPRCAVLLRFDCETEGVGVDPDDPPLAWEAWTDDGWQPCELHRDGTGGLNRTGDVVIHVPPDHTTSAIARRPAGWIRARVVETRPDQHGYSASPRIDGLTAATVGGNAPATHAETVDGEHLGVSEGVPGQRFALRRSPVLTDVEPPVVEVGGEDGDRTWERVDDFVGSGPDDRHFTLDAATGEIVFGPAVRDPDGSLRQHGAVPPKGADLRVPRYAVGGGRRGNVGAGALRVLKRSIPYVTAVDNPRPATGGVDGESIDEVRSRAPTSLRTRQRAVTAEDHEHLVRRAAPEFARVVCLEMDPDRPEGGGVRILVVPEVEEPIGEASVEELRPRDDVLERVRDDLESRRTVGTRVRVEPPTYRPVTVAVLLRTAAPGTDRIEAGARAALYRYLSPLVGGPDGAGWPVGRTVHVRELHGVLQQVPDVRYLEDARLYPVDPSTGERGDAVEELELPPTGLPLSYEHQVTVQPVGGR